MPPIANHYLVNSADYEKGYTEGFGDMKRAALKRIKAIEKDLESLEALVGYTTTSTTIGFDESGEITKN